MNGLQLPSSEEVYKSVDSGHDVVFLYTEVVWNDNVKCKDQQ